MFKRSFFIIALVQLVFLSCKDKKSVTEVKDMAQKQILEKAKISFENDEEAKKVIVKINGTEFTSYVYDQQTPKPILYPIITKSGKTITRGFPYAPRANERVDHPHHAGLWFNYGDVNGLDFWNNSYAIPESEKDKYGSIIPIKIIGMDAEKGMLSVKAVWRTSTDADLLEETTSFVFGEEGTTRFIERTTVLKALVDVAFKDNKEGMIGLRVARELEMPSDKPAVFTDSKGIVTTVKAANNDGVSGDYLSSDGKTGNDVWGTRNNWVRLQGVIKGETVSVTILENKKNVGYPTYWHARGYGLFAANPLGQAAFSDGKEVLDFKLKKGASVTFKYKILIHNGSELAKGTIEQAFSDFNSNNH